MYLPFEVEWWQASVLLLGFGWGKFLSRVGMAAGGVFTGGATWGMLAASIAGDVIGGVAQSRAAGKASDELQAGAKEGIGYEREAQRLHSPYYKAGLAQLDTLGKLAGTSGADIHKLAIMDPSYEFRFSEGMRARDRTAASKGTLMTGGHIKNTIKFGQDYASTEYGAAYDRASAAVTNQFGRASVLAGAGQTAGQNMSTSIGRMAGYSTDAATARADEATSKCDVWANTASNIAGNIGGMIAGAGRNRGSAYEMPNQVMETV